MPRNRVMLIGWDAADWKVLRPLLDAGQMPNLARLMDEGVHGNLATIYPVLSPMLWTSIATGKRAFKHGIHGFTEPLPDGSGVRPATTFSRKTKALWNILNQNGRRSVVVGWWPSHPAEPINGVMVSNHFAHPAGAPGNLPPLQSGTVYPTALATTLAELRVNPMELTGEFIRPFVPEYDRVDQAKDKRLHMLGKIVAETMSIHAVATELLQTQAWDFAAVYYNAIDHFGHGFMRYHPPRLPWVPETDFAVYQHVIANAYRYHDAMLGALLRFADPQTTVVLMSDHGFHPDHLRPAYIPAEPAGPAVEHRHFGILCMKGPGLRANEQLFGAGLLDICPTVLTLFGLQPGKDMDGKVLLTAFREPPRIEPIDTWDAVPGDAGTHPPDAQLDPVASAEAFKQLVDLGYVAPPGPNVSDTVEECVRELKYNLARAYLDADRGDEAAPMLEELWTHWPKEHRFGLLLIDCLGALGEVARRRTALDELTRRVERYQAEAQTELARRKKSPGKPPAKPGPRRQRREQFELRQRRELARGRPLLSWYMLTQALLEHNRPEARRRLQSLLRSQHSSTAMCQRLAGAMAEMGDLQDACRLLEQSLGADPENAAAHAQLAAIHLKTKHFDDAIAAATESLSLIYFQPRVHALLGQALIQKRQFAEAEKELLVAVAQNPRNLIAHTLLAGLYRDRLGRPGDAFAHEGRARSLRHELAARKRADRSSPRLARDLDSQFPGDFAATPVHLPEEMPPPFGPDVDGSQVIVVVSGLPRSGTSLMMQLLVAAGRHAMTDGQRPPDEDNPLGYLEFEPVRRLARDCSWVPQARGKAIKIVAQLLPHLPPNEQYHVILMERDLSEVIASQQAMLIRHGRPGAKLDGRQLLQTYAAQLGRIRRRLARRAEMRMLSVSYSELLANPAAGVERLARFLGDPFNREAAARAIKPELRRQKRVSE